MITARVTPESELIEKVVYINRVAKVVKGGRRFSFGAIVVVGDGKGNVGMAHGKANEVPEAISKGTERAKRLMTKVTVVDGTLPHEVIGRYGASTVYPRPDRIPGRRRRCPRRARSLWRRKRFVEVDRFVESAQPRSCNVGRSEQASKP